MNTNLLFLITVQRKPGVKLEHVGDLNGETKTKETFITSNHIFIRLDYIKDLDEVRAGFRAQTFGRLVENGHVQSIDVINPKDFRSSRGRCFSRRVVHLQ